MSMSMSSVREGLFELLVGAQIEIFIFLVAFGAHAIVFGRHPLGIWPRRSKGALLKGATEKSRSSSPPPSPKPEKKALALPERSAIIAALRRGDADFLREALAGSDATSRMALVRSFASEQRLTDSFAIFEACPEKTTVLYNTLLDACIESKDLVAAARVLRLAMEAKTADVVTFNTMIKGYIQSGHCQRAQSTLEAMRGAGFAPNCVTFNALLDATVKEQPGRDRDVWQLVSEMQGCGLRPNHVTCSILLKCIQRSSSTRDVERVLAMLEDTDDIMDEVLLSSVCEACIRAGCKDLLTQQLGKQRTGLTQVKGAHSYGSVIRAHGYVDDVKGVWAVWNEMTARHVVPTSVTLGCMVEALASNGDPEAGYSLIREFMESPQKRVLVNAVIYGSVQKMLSHHRKYDRVWALYEEMKAEGLQFSIVTYNALIDTCSRSSDMRRIPALLEEMASVKIEPNIITYGTVIKGYCHVDCVDKAFELLQDMKKSKGLHPDEVTYNTLMDGCARYGKWQEGVGLLDEMRDAGVPPTNFTLSVLVKLAGRCKRPERAFELTEELCAKYSIRLNVHVFNNLIHICTTTGGLPRACQLVERMLREKVRPDARTYLLLVRGAVRAKAPREIASFLRAAGGLPGAHHTFKAFPHLSQPKGGLLADTVAEAIEGAARIDAQLGQDLLREVRGVPSLPLDPRVSMRLARRSCRE